MPILISVITIVWIILTIFFARGRTILIDQDGFHFTKIKKLVTYKWVDIKDIDISKKKNYIAVTFQDGELYATDYSSIIENLINLYKIKS
jgi:hypothetical protein